MDCEFLDNCSFFNNSMNSMPSVSDVYRKIYCHGNNENCACHMIAERLGADRIPPTVYPNNRDVAVKIISGQASV